MLEFPEPAYEGEQYSAQDVESLRQGHKERHQEAISEFRGLERDYESLSGEIRGRAQETDWAGQLDRLAKGPTLGDKVRGALAKVGLASRPRPIAEVLEEQLEDVQDRIHRVARLRESLDGHTADLEADIRRLNTDVVQAAKNEEAAAKHVLELSQRLDGQEQALLDQDPAGQGSAAHRQAMADADELKAQIRLHGSKARAFGHAENRLESILRMNRSFLEMLRHTAENMEQLAGAAHQVVDEIAGNVQALTRLTLANEMALDLMQSSRRLKEGINQVAKLASGTSLELTRDIDRFVAEMQVYDEATIDLVESNLSEERRLRQEQVEAAIAHAWEAGADGA